MVSKNCPRARTRQKQLGQVDFALKFYDKESIKKTSEWDQIKAIQGWCEAYLKWLGVLHANGIGLRWFNVTAFYNQDNLILNPSNFPDLVEKGRDKEINVRIKHLSKKNLKGTDNGTTGLAKALYQVLSKNRI